MKQLPKVCMARGMAESDSGSESGYCSSEVTVSFWLEMLWLGRCFPVSFRGREVVLVAC